MGGMNEGGKRNGLNLRFIDPVLPIGPFRELLT